MSETRTARLTAAPQQRRSVESHERVLAATTRLLTEGRGAAFTLADVSKESGVSVGGIYGRFGSRDTLVQEVQLRVNQQMHLEYAAAINALRDGGHSEHQLIIRLTEESAEALRRHHRMLRALVDASLSDPVVAREGLRAYALHLALFEALLLERGGAMPHAQPAQAIHFCFQAIYELVASHFGFGRRTSAGDGKWPALVRQLTNLCVAYLTTAPAQEP